MSWEGGGVPLDFLLLPVRNQPVEGPIFYPAGASMTAFVPSPTHFPNSLQPQCAVWSNSLFWSSACKYFWIPPMLCVLSIPFLKNHFHTGSTEWVIPDLQNNIQPLSELPNFSIYSITGSLCWEMRNWWRTSHIFPSWGIEFDI